jgi:hypothetical protein
MERAREEKSGHTSGYTEPVQAVESAQSIRAIN